MSSLKPRMIASGGAIALVLTLLAAPPRSAAQEAFSVEKGIRIEPGGGYLGIEMEDVTAENMASYKLTAERGVIVRKVMKGSPAEAAGLQENDVILQYAGIPVLSAQQMSRLVRETPVGRKVDLAVSRDGKKLDLSAKIGQREKGPGVIEGGPGTMMFQGPEGHTFHFRVPQGEGPFPSGPGMQWFGMGEPSKPRLGVTLQPLTDQLAAFLGVTGGKGVLITSVIEGSPAAGKLKAGDVIVSADGQPIDDLGELTRIVREKPEGGKLELKVVRDKKELTVTVDLGGTGTKPQPKGFKL
jgi:serine protease Do